MNLRIGLIFILISLAGCGASRPKLLLLGDSIMAGGMSKDGKGVMSYLDYEITNKAVGGSKPHDVIKAIADLGPHEFDYVFIYTGTNLMGNPRIVEYVLDLEWLATWFNFYMPETRVYFFQLLKLGGELEKNAVIYNAMLSQTNHKNVKNIDTRKLFEDNGCGKNCMADAVHPNDKGYKALAKIIKDHI